MRFGKHVTRYVGCGVMPVVEVIEFATKEVLVGGVTDDMAAGHARDTCNGRENHLPEEVGPVRTEG
jgi:hypothetical protein